MSDEFGEAVTLEPLVDLLQDEVARLLRDVIGDDANRLVLLFDRRGDNHLTLQRRCEFIGIVLDLEETHRGANLVKRALGKRCAGQLLEPLDAAEIGIALGRVVGVLAGDPSKVYLRSSFQGKNYFIADLHLVDEAKELARAHGNSARLRARVDLFVPFLKLVACFET